jgi:protein-disulfide isomerase
VPAAIVLAGILIAGAILWSANQKAAKTKQVPAEGNAKPVAQKEGVRPVPPLKEGDHIRGNPDAPIVLIEYSDYECPFCKRFHSTLQAMMETYGKQGKVAWAYRHFPLTSIHPKALQAAKAAECAAQVAGNDGFWRFTDAYFKNTPANNHVELSLLPEWAQEAGIERAAFEACLTSNADRFLDRIEQQTQGALAAGARGTPFTVIVTKKPLGDQSLALLNAINQQVGQNVFDRLSENQVSLSGAVPREMLEPVLNTILEDIER